MKFFGRSSGDEALIGSILDAERVRANVAHALGETGFLLVSISEASAIVPSKIPERSLATVHQLPARPHQEDLAPPAVAPPSQPDVIARSAIAPGASVVNYLQEL